MPGPIPKRSDERRRRNKPEIDVDYAPAGQSALGQLMPETFPRDVS